MAVVSSRGNEKKWSPEEVGPAKLKPAVPVIYYLSRNGQLDHPHFIEVPLSSSSQALYLRDVINRLNSLRGKGMASLYSWSSKRSYKNGFVWHDLEENDFIYPAHGTEYVLKGSEIIETNSISKSDEASSSSNKLPPERRNSGDFAAVTRRRNQSWSAIDLQEYKVYAGEIAADAATQTDDKRPRRREIREIEEEKSTVLSRDEISPPPSDSSPETLESLMKVDGRVVLCAPEDQTAEISPIKASSVLMQLISCGSMSFRDCGGPSGGNGFSLISRVARGSGSGRGLIEKGRVEVEDKEYFSGSLIETKEEFVPALKRSSSYNADRRSQLELMEKERDGATAKCIPRRPKTRFTKKEELKINNDISCNDANSHSKRIVVQP